MLRNNRVIFNDNGTTKDLSAVLNDIQSGASLFDLVAADDALYIGSDLPFNHRYFEFTAPNQNNSTITVETWNGSEWVEVVDLLDETKDGQVSFAKNGIVSWVPDRDESWQKVADTFDTVDGLDDLKIYDLYWVKVSFSANLTTTMGLKYCGHKFSRDEDLGGKYAELVTQNALDSFADDKTSWDEQHILAAEDIVRDLRKKRVIWNRNQVVDWQTFTDASVHKVAYIAFSAFGDAFIEKRDEAKRNYDQSMAGLNFDVDLNENAVLDEEEKEETNGFFRV